ncbi:neuromedin-K receptor-like isoform X1 [Montipora capricornis]|uniref:neuromedin-K receptor-like isoform X1 n=2 Tax=Montipora capricornis TaxID=246305 RepID=UPI0035F163CA
MSSEANVTLSDTGNTPGTPVKTAAIVLYSFIITIALAGNIFVIYILYRKIETRRLTSFMYVNLAVADLLVTCFAMPLQLQAILMDNRWFGGAFSEFLAKFVVFTFFVAVMASVYSLTTIAFDSFFSIVLSLRQFPRFRNQKILVPSIWLFSMCAMSPWLLIIKVRNPKGQSFVIHQEFSQFGDINSVMRGVFLYVVAIIYVFPLAIMSFLYGCICQKLRSHKIPGASVSHDEARLRMNKTKRQMIKTSIAIVIAFALCWLPVHISHVMFAVDRVWAFRKFPFFHYFMLVSFWCGHANSAVNPWMLIYFKKRFRAEFGKMVTLPLSHMSTTSHFNFRETSTKRASSKAVTLTDFCQVTSSL